MCHLCFAPVSVSGTAWGRGFSGLRARQVVAGRGLLITFPWRAAWCLFCVYQANAAHAGGSGHSSRKKSSKRKADGGGGGGSRKKTALASTSDVAADSSAGNTGLVVDLDAGS